MQQRRIQNAIEQLTEQGKLGLILSIRLTFGELLCRDIIFQSRRWGGTRVQRVLAQPT